MDAARVSGVAGAGSSAALHSSPGDLASLAPPASAVAPRAVAPRIVWREVERIVPEFQGRYPVTPPRGGRRDHADAASSARLDRRAARAASADGPAETLIDQIREVQLRLGSYAGESGLGEADADLPAAACSDTVATATASSRGTPSAAAPPGAGRPAATIPAATRAAGSRRPPPAPVAPEVTALHFARLLRHLDAPQARRLLDFDAKRDAAEFAAGRERMDVAWGLDLRRPKDLAYRESPLAVLRVLRSSVLGLSATGQTLAAERPDNAIVRGALHALIALTPDDAPVGRAVAVLRRLVAAAGPRSGPEVQQRLRDCASLALALVWSTLGYPGAAVAGTRPPAKYRELGRTHVFIEQVTLAWLELHETPARKLAAAAATGLSATGTAGALTGLRYDAIIAASRRAERLWRACVRASSDPLQPMFVSLLGFGPILGGGESLDGRDEPEVCAAAAGCPAPATPAGSAGADPDDSDGPAARSGSEGDLESPALPAGGSAGGDPAGAPRVRARALALSLTPDSCAPPSGPGA